LPLGLAAFLRPETVDPGEIRADLPGLYPDFALAGEATDQAFSAEEQSFEAAAAKAGHHRNLILKCVLEGDDEACVDDVIVGDVDFQNGPEGSEEDVSRAGSFKQHQAFAAEEALGPLPFAGDTIMLSPPSIRPKEDSAPPFRPAFRVRFGDIDAMADGSAYTVSPGRSFTSNREKSGRKRISNCNSLDMLDRSPFRPV